MALALEHPAYGCNRIEALSMLEGRRVSAITIQKLLNELGLKQPPNRTARTAADAMRLADVAVDQRLHRVGDILLAKPAHLGDEPLRGPLGRLVAAGVLLILAHSLYVLQPWSRGYLSRMTEVSRNLNFAAAILNLILWSVLVRRQRGDLQMLLVSAGVDVRSHGGTKTAELFDAEAVAPRPPLPDAPAFTLDDLIDFHFLLQREGWFADLERAVNRRAAP